MLESPDNRAYLLPLALQYLRGLHDDQFHQRPDACHTTWRWDIFNPSVRKNLSILLRSYRKKLQDRAHLNGWKDGQLETAYRAVEERKLAFALRGRWHHPYSTPGYPIQSIEYGMFQLTQELETIVMKNPSLEHCQRIALIFFDNNCQKAINDCTSQSNGGNHLKKITHLLLDTETVTRQWLERECAIRVTPLVAGGDEFTLMLQSNTPMSTELLHTVVRCYQEEMSCSAALRASVNFDDPHLLMHYGLSESERKEFQALPDQTRQQRLREIRMTLPKEFIPSMAGGAARLDEAIIRAMRYSLEDRQPLFNDPEETFLFACEKIFTVGLRGLAEARQREDKEKQKAEWKRTDPRQYHFALRNRENRRLAQQTEALRGLLRQITDALIESDAVAQEGMTDGELCGLSAQETAAKIAAIIVAHEAFPDVQSIADFRRPNNHDASADAPTSPSTH
ncbi:MAG: hypothetical protein PHH13_05325 [Candidatus Peribacteraceae bacterium]|nr:hypothetical protein [Candidatus Peribacteraceae bacterium]